RNESFRDGNNYHKCPAPLEEHSGRGEEVAMIDISADASGVCTCGLYNSKLGLAMSLRFRKEQLPWLMNWQHWGTNEYVTGIEPSTNKLIGQAKARERKELIFLQPGDSRTYDLEIEVFDNQEKIDLFLKK
ncbi:MAG: DUF4432 family protein, partial [Segetibacter sp.]